MTAVFRSLCRLGAAALAVWIAGATVHAQSDPLVGPPPPRPVTRRTAPPWPAVRAYFLVDSTAMRAKQSFDAILGKTRLTTLGGGADVRIWRGLFARAAASTGQFDGTRVVLDEDEPLSLGIPLTIQIKPVELGLGWRPRRAVDSPLVPYAGGGLLLMYYRETSEFADTDEDTDARYSGLMGFVGMEAAIGRWVVAAVEAQYRTVKDAIGAGGVSAAFGEDDLGGVTVRVLVGIGR